ncbi:MAG: FtsX-like permease family protein, partial [Sarcina sp.]
NIFYISIVNDIRFYGQLKTLGCTQKQIRKLIYKMGIKASIIGIPFATILGLFLGRVIGEISLKETIVFEYINFNNYIIPSIIGVIFTLATLWISIRKPVKVLEKISAVEAIKHNVVQSFNYKKKIKKTKKGDKIKVMAKENMIKNKKKVITSVLSIALSSTLLSAGMIIMIGLDVDEHVRRYVVGDIDIDLEYRMIKKIEDKDIEKLKGIDGVKNVEVTLSGYRNIEEFFYDKSKIKVDEEAMDKEFSKYEMGYSFEKDKEYIDTKVTGISKEMLNRNLDRVNVEGNIDLEKFNTGNYVIIDRGNRIIENGLKKGDKITLNNIEFEVMGIVEDKDEDYISTSFGVINISKENLSKILGEEITPSKVVIDMEKGYEGMALNEIKEIFKEKGNVRSVSEFKEGVKNLKHGILGGVFLGSTIFLAIALLNMINIAITDLIERKREFGSLEAIGMERGMLMKLISYEGRYYLTFSILAIIPLSLIAAFFIPKMMPIYGSFSLGAVVISISLIGVLIYLIMITFKKKMLKNILKEPLSQRLEEY